MPPKGMIFNEPFRHEFGGGAVLKAGIVDDLIERRSAIEAINVQIGQCDKSLSSFDISMKDEYAVKVERASLVAFREILEYMPPAQPEIIRCKDCKHNPKYEWFGCPMSHLSEKQRPETAWCWKAERRSDG